MDEKSTNAARIPLYSKVPQRWGRYLNPILDCICLSFNSKVDGLTVPILRHIFMPVAFIIDILCAPPPIKGRFDKKFHKLTRFYILGLHVTALVRIGILVCLVKIVIGVVWAGRTFVRQRFVQYAHGNPHVAIDGIAMRLPPGDEAYEPFQQLKLFSFILILLILPMMLRNGLFFLPLQLFCAYMFIWNIYDAYKFASDAFLNYWTAFHRLYTFNEYNKTLHTAETDANDFVYIFQSKNHYRIIFDLYFKILRFTLLMFPGYVMDRVMQYYKWDRILDRVQNCLNELCKPFISYFLHYNRRLFHLIVASRLDPLSSRWLDEYLKEARKDATKKSKRYKFDRMRKARGIARLKVEKENKMAKKEAENRKNNMTDNAYNESEVSANNNKMLNGSPDFAKVV
ncbi:unnamed protein product [Bursaphelenchus xylophilus]|uniref:(pine wood nematode) hypothetical protein n=1 Tax=Bursaphelenchus xylophilus TaxID=6326 RepID=A0A1I7S3T4_BURXY|nr:unnamed protein product [Bursaphelenchus xylophilus]CAG9116506.1 unnamed protein product [Bursaphelenchus xylophilus]